VIEISSALRYFFYFCKENNSDPTFTISKKINMKKILLSLVVAAFLFSTSTAQVVKTDDVKKSLETTNKDTIAWTHGGVISMGLNEGFLHNWAAGGELASLTANGIFSGHLDRLHNQLIWSNNLDMTYGLNYAFSTGFTPRKTDDRIDFTSKLGLRHDSGNIFFTALFNFKSQFTKGYDYTLKNYDSASTSAFMAPAYFTTAIGVEYRRGSDLSLFFSPIAGRLSVATKEYTSRSPEGAFGVPYNKTSYFQFGAYFSGRYNWNISKNMVYKTRLDLYSNYLAKDTKDSTGTVIKKDNPGNIAVLFDNLFSWKVSKYLSFILGATFIYDNNIPYNKYVPGTTTLKDEPGRDIGWLQIKQVFNLGFEYKF
jgi:Protein of unknown function (DUF3078)